jgi:CheY-like chemotaxis protein
MGRILNFTQKWASMDDNRRLAAEIAHDFNNLLTVINGQSEWILRRLPEGDPTRPGLEAIYRAGLRAAELARELLAISGATDESAAAKPRILIADDEPQVRRYVRKVLEKAGYDVWEAEDGREAVRLAQIERVDVVITDLVMPNQEGLETIQILRRQAPEVAIVAISGAFHPEYLEVARKLGAAVALAKPLTAEELLGAVSQALASRKSGT